MKTALNIQPDLFSQSTGETLALAGMTVAKENADRVVSGWSLHNKQRLDDAEDVQQYMVNKKEQDPFICKEFGCGKHLSLEESRYGNKCIGHSGKTRDIFLCMKNMTGW